MPGDVGMSRTRSSHELSILRHGPKKFKVGVDRPAHTRAPRYVSLDGCEQDRSFSLNGSRMIKIDSGVRSILLAMPSLGAKPGREVCGSAAAGDCLDCSGGGIGVDCSGVCRDRRCEHRHAHGQERNLPARAAGWRFCDPALEQRNPLRACRRVLMPSGAAQTGR
jgi:hypothetical protein